MKFTAAVLALAGAVSAWNNVTYTTEVVESIVTYCPEATTLTHGSKTYTITAPTTLTITECPCTLTKPVTTSSVVVCKTCGYNATSPAAPPATTPTTAVYTTGAVKPTASTVVTAGAGKVALSGAALAAVMGVAALL